MLSRRRARGFTLAEALIASVVLAAGVIGISSSFAASYQQTKAAEHMTTSVALARELMEEISSKPFDDPNGTSALGPETGETTRSLYDNVDDYNGYTDSTDPTASNAISNLSGTALSLGDGEIFTRSVTVVYRRTVSGATTSSGDFALVTVTVTDPQGRTLTVSRLFARTTWSMP